MVITVGGDGVHIDFMEPMTAVYYLVRCIFHPVVFSPRQTCSGKRELRELRALD
jgi:hypothetical protein